MKKWFMTFVMLSLTVSILCGQSSDTLKIVPPQDAKRHVKHFIRQIRNLQNNVSAHAKAPGRQNDLIIGDIDPNEVVTITGNYLLNGDILILNNGVLNLDSADFKINGDITILGTGRLNAAGGSFTVIQEYLYEHEALVLQGGQFNFDNVNFRSSGQSWSVGLGDSASYFLKNSQISDGFITTGMFHRAKAQIENTKIPGEFLCMGENDLQFRNCNFLLMWLVLIDSSVVDVSLPEDSLLTGWHFANGDSGVSGIPYSVSIDSCTEVMWGIISQSGSDATFRNTKFRTSGLMFNRPDSIVVQNITNGSVHVDDLIDVPDRNLHLVNSEVATWNFYPSANSNITVLNCIFGELLAMDSSRAFIDNSICDGSGGYLGAVGKSLLVTFRTLISSQVIARENGVLLGAFSAFNGQEIDADDLAGLALLNTSTLVEPEAHNGAFIFEAQMPPVEGFTENNVSIEGTARIITGPQNPLQFVGYDVKFAPDSLNPVWQNTDGLHNNPVVNDTLALWNTAGLSPGPYQLQLSIFHNFGDSISIISPARLEEFIAALNEGDNNSIQKFALHQNYPNPFNPATTITYQLPAASDVELIIYNLLGQKIKTMVLQRQPAGSYQIKWDGKNEADMQVPSGIYMYRLKAGSSIHTRKMILMR